MKYYSEEKDFLKKRKNGLMLSDSDIEILKENNINYLEYQSLEELLYAIDKYLEETDNVLLDELSIKLQEMKYYHYTNK